MGVLFFGPFFCRELNEKIDEHIAYYNTHRIKLKLNGLTPVEYRNQVLQSA